MTKKKKPIVILPAWCSCPSPGNSGGGGAERGVWMELCYILPYCICISFTCIYYDIMISDRSNFNVLSTRTPLRKKEEQNCDARVCYAAQCIRVERGGRGCRCGGVAFVKLTPVSPPLWKYLIHDSFSERLLLFSAKVVVIQSLPHCVSNLPSYSSP